MKKISILFSLALAALFANACASVATMQTAGTVPEGEIRWAISSTGTGGNGDAKPTADPNFEASVRYGVADRVDVGLKINFLGAQLGAKYQILRGDFDLSIDIEAGYQWVRTSGTNDPSGHVFDVQLPVLMEYHFNPYVGLAFGPKFLGVIVAETDKRDDIWNDSGLYVGIMVGLPLRLTDGIWFQPEFNVYSNAYDGAENSFTNLLWHAGVSVFFGGLDGY